MRVPALSPEATHALRPFLLEATKSGPFWTHSEDRRPHICYRCFPLVVKLSEDGSGDVRRAILWRRGLRGCHTSAHNPPCLAVKRRPAALTLLSAVLGTNCPSRPFCLGHQGPPWECPCRVTCGRKGPAWEARDCPRSVHANHSLCGRKELQPSSRTRASASAKWDSVRARKGLLS